MSVLIIEGTDGVGKTTLAKRYAEQTGATYLHASAPVGLDPWAEYVAPLIWRQRERDDFLTQGPDFVCDRWHVGEMVWPEIFGRKSILLPEGFRLISETLVALYDARFLLLIRDPDKIKAELYGRGESKVAIYHSLIAQTKFAKEFAGLHVDFGARVRIMPSTTAWAIEDLSCLGRDL